MLQISSIDCIYVCMYVCQKNHIKKESYVISISRVFVVVLVAALTLYKIVSVIWDIEMN